MISINTGCNPEPLPLRPAGKDYLWGGTRLKEEYGKDLPLFPLAETWECSVHPDGPSIVAGGTFEGKSLARVLAENPAWVGTHPRENGFDTLPVLIKLIDAKRDLSVQVHPDDEYARAHEGQPGKTEMWYILEAKPGAKLIYGFSRDVTEEAVRESIADGGLMRCLRTVPVHKGDVFFIPPGTVHAIGNGTLLAEIQESSNLTYRVYDYGRRDKSGSLRELHIEKALRVMNFKRGPDGRRKLRVLRYRSGSAEELLARCGYFQVSRLMIGGNGATAVGEGSFQVLLCLEGSGRLDAGGKRQPLHKGDCVFLPAGLGKTAFGGRMELLKIEC